MELKTIDLEKLKTTKVNVRKKDAKEMADLLPSIRALGLLQPLLVRPNCDGYEVVAGGRRLQALRTLAEEGGKAAPVPCIVMAAGDDARAIEASLAENIARLPMDEIDQYKAFAALIKQGLDAESIAARFGVTERLVRQRLAIANLAAPILTAYRNGDIHVNTVRLLTMATPKQQKAWLALYRGDAARAPEGYRLKCWLFGGAEIETGVALFDLDLYPGNLVADLFGEATYFDDAEAFWALQSSAIAEAAARYRAEGWTDVIVLDIGEPWFAYEHVDTAKEDGGKVFIRPTRNGEVLFYEGQLHRKEARKRQAAADTASEPSPPSKPEITHAMQNYLALHRHAAVRAALLGRRGLALRLAVAQIIAGSGLWTVCADPQKAQSPAIGESLAANKAEAVLRGERNAVKALLEIESPPNHPVARRSADHAEGGDLHSLFAKLIELKDADVMRILAYVVAETLPCGGDLVEALGQVLKVDMADCWVPDQTFFDLLRDKPAINAMVREAAGKNAADAHVVSTAKVQKSILQDCLKGERDGGKADWTPRYMQFPMKACTKRGGIRAMEEWALIKRCYR
ncbi:MAG: ParB/RepB/Spo0J family partition protein [Alphaproteobacteria bacterium]|nr:ParB/RepB/Spo0J family partition protein [Alphaproteobacteria bacterium]